jgi:hypothetical protein
VKLFEDPDHADVGDAASTASGEDEDKLGFFLLFFRFFGHNWNGKSESNERDDETMGWLGFHDASLVFRG